MEEQDQLDGNSVPPQEASKSWRESLSDESLRSNKSLEKFNGAEPLAKSYIELESKLGRSIEVPSGEADHEAWNKFYSRLTGVKAPEKYTADVESKRKEVADKELAESKIKAYDVSLQKLKDKHGDKYEEVVAKASKAFAKMFIGKDELYSRLQSMGLDNDADMVETFSEFANVINPDDNPIQGEKRTAPADQSYDAWKNKIYERYGGGPTPGRT